MKAPEISLIFTGSGRSVSSFGWTRFALAALATAGPVMAADVTSMWTSPASGNWNAGANWTNVPLSGGFPNNGNGGVATYDATINAVGGSYTVTLGTEVTIEDLLLNSGNATLSHTTGTFTATGGISLAAGTYQLSGGTISNTAINLSGGNLAFTSSAGILSNGTVLNSDLNLSANNSSVRLFSGADFTGVANLTGASTALTYQETRTITGKTINLEGSGAKVAIDGTTTLTLGSGTLVRGRGNLGQAAFVGGTNGLVNQGTIRADLTGQTLTISTNTFSNTATGLVAATNGGRLTVNGTWSNAGQISVTNGSTLDYSGTWNNAGGTVTLDGTSTLNLDGNMTANGLGTISNSAGGTVNVTGKLDNTGNTLTFSAATGSWQLKAGEISGGQITPGAGGTNLVFTSSAGILSNGAVLNGDLNLSANNSSVRLFSGADFTGVANLTGSSTALTYQETRTITGRTINLEGSGAKVAIDGTTTLTLGSGTVVRGRGNLGQAAFVGGTNGLVNQGTIRADLTGQTLTISTNTFANTATGLVSATNGGRLIVNGTWSNAGQISVTNASTLDYNGTWNNAGGTVTLDGTSTLNFDGNMVANGLGTVSNSAGGTVNVTGKLDNTGNTLTFGPATGSWQLKGGEISGGQITPGAGGEKLVFTTSAGILSNGVVLNGDLNLSANNSSVRLFSGADFTGVANLTGSSTALTYQETRTITGKTINLEGSGAKVAIDGTTTLTLGSGTLVRGRGNLGQAAFVGGTNGLVNQGTIRADLTGQTLTISTNTFSNTATGLVAVSNGARLTINGAWSNTGQLSATNASTLDYSGTWNNAGGTVSIDGTSTLNLDGNMTANGLGTISNSAGGTVNVTGKLDNSGNILTFGPATGSWQLKGGEISGGQITPGAGGEKLVFTTSAGILSNGVVLNGDLNLSANNSSVRLFSGADFTGVANLTGASTALAYQETRTITGRTINLEGSGAKVAIDGTTTLTLGAGTLVRGRGNLGQAAFVGGTNGLVNQGTIRADLTGQTLTISTNTFSNTATALVSATNGGRMTINGTWSNAGQISVTNASTLDYNGTWNNTGGTVTIDATSTLNLDGTSTPAGLGTVSNSAGGTVNVTGKLDNTGNNLTFSPATGSWQLKGGEISGGQITPGAGGEKLVFTTSAGILSNGAVLNGDLNLSANNSSVRLFSGADFTGVANLTGSSAMLAYQETRTITGKTINLDGSNARLAIDGTTTLTLGSGTLVRGRGTLGQAGFVGGTSGLVNQGTIRSDLAGQTLSILSNTFSNAGVVSAESGGSLAVNLGYVQTTGSTRVAGGTINTGNTGTRELIRIDGGSLEGRGIINSNVTVGGTLAPDLLDAAGLAINGNLSLTGTAVMSFDVGGTTQGVLYDFLKHTSTTPVTLAGSLKVQFANDYEECMHGADTFVLFASNQDLAGTFANVVSGGRLTTSDGLGSFKVHYGPASSFGPKSIVLSDYTSAASGLVLGQFAAWVTAMGLPPGQAGATDDPDQDGLTNAIEYALGLHPMQVQGQSVLSAPTVTTTATAPTSLEMSFRMVNPQPADLGLTIEASPGLAGPWQRIGWKSSSSAWCGAASVQGAPIAGQTPVTITDTQSISATPRRFLRLRVTITQP